jgi:hypothetical protein
MCKLTFRVKSFSGRVLGIVVLDVVNVFINDGDCVWADFDISYRRLAACQAECRHNEE